MQKIHLQCRGQSVWPSRLVSLKMKAPGIVCPMWCSMKPTAGEELLTKVSNLNLIEPLAIASSLLWEKQTIEAQVTWHRVQTRTHKTQEVPHLVCVTGKSVLTEEAAIVLDQVRLKWAMRHESWLHFYWKNMQSENWVMTTGIWSWTKST